MKKIILSLVMVAGICLFANAQAPEAEAENPAPTEETTETTETTETQEAE